MVENFPKLIKILTTIPRPQKTPSKIITAHTHTHDYDIRQSRLKNKKYYIMIKGSTHQESITILNVYTPKTRTLKYIEKKLLNCKKGRESHNYC